MTTLKIFIKEQAKRRVNGGIKMRDYLMPAVKYLIKVIPSPSLVKAFVARRRAFVFIFVATLLMVTTSALLVVRHFVDASAARNNGMITSGSPKKIPGVQASQQVTNIVSPTNGSASSTVTVNGQSVSLPANGSVHKTINTDNGTTKIDMTVSGNATNSNISTTSNNLQVVTSPDSSTSQLINP